jgi:gas vesicle protein
MSDNDAGTKVAFFLAGAGIGALVALLFAPKSGKDTREYIVKRAEEGRDYVSARSREIRSQAEDLVDKGKDLVSKQKDMLSAALEAGKSAYQDAKK